jgi:signal transduction histidine kinase
MIKAYAEMVRDITYKDKKKREENLNVIIEETDRLNLLVGDILALSKLQTNNSYLELEVFDLNIEITNILKRYDYLKEIEGYEI